MYFNINILSAFISFLVLLVVFGTIFDVYKQYDAAKANQRVSDVISSIEISVINNNNILNNSGKSFQENEINEASLETPKRKQKNSNSFSL